MYVISYGGTSSHNMQLTEFGIPTERYAPDTIILEMRSEVTVTVIWICYVTLHHPKMHPHTKFMIPTLNEGVSVGKIFATMLLPALSALIWYATWPYSEKV